MAEDKATKAERLINLIACLLDSKRPLTLNELNSTVYYNQKVDEDTLRRMFERDKDELREMGIPIEMIKDENSGEYAYTIEPDKYYLPDIDFASDELISLSIVSRFFIGSGTAFSGSAHSALLKFATSAARDPEELKYLRVVPHVHMIEGDKKNRALDQILEALRKRKLVTFDYRALSSKKPVTRTVEPYGVVSKNGFWYLIGKCRLRNAVRCFKLDRITSKVEVNKKKPKQPDFDIPEDFDLREAASWENLMEPRDQPVKVTVELSPKIAFMASHSPFGVLSEKRKKSGFCSVVFRVEHPESFLDWILDFGTEAKIISPHEMRVCARERVEGILKKVK